MLAGRIGETLNDTPRHREINYLLARKVLEAMPLISYPQISMSCLHFVYHWEMRIGKYLN